MPTFHKAFKEVGIVPISIICFMENRHKFTKEGKNKDLGLNIVKEKTETWVNHF